MCGHAAPMRVRPAQPTSMTTACGLCSAAAAPCAPHVGRRLPDDDVVACHALARRNQPIFVKVRVVVPLDPCTARHSMALHGMALHGMALHGIAVDASVRSGRKGSQAVVP